MVIRERVELGDPAPRGVTPAARTAVAPDAVAAGPAVAARGATACDGPVAGYAIFRGRGGPTGSVWTSGAPLSGTFTSVGACGSATGDLAPAFAFQSIWTGHHGGADRYNYAPLDSVEIVRLPLRGAEPLVDGVLDIPDAGVLLTGLAGGFVGTIGCRADVYNVNQCVADNPNAIRA